MAPAATSCAMLARVGPSVAGRAHARGGPPLPAAGRVVHHRHQAAAAIHPRWLTVGPGGYIHVCMVV